MRLTAETLLQFEADLKNRQQLAIQYAMGVGRRGLLPGEPFAASGAFVRRTYEMDSLKCTAVLPSGKIISADGDFKLPIEIDKNIPDHYVVLEYSGNMVELERDGVPYTVPEVVLGLHTLSDVENGDMMPLKHFYIKDGSLNIDNDYIVPVYCIDGNSTFQATNQKLASQLKELAAHANMENGSAKQMLLHNSFRLNAFDGKRTVNDLISLYEEIAEALDFYIVEVLGEKIGEVPEEVKKLKADVRRKPYLSDIRRFLIWITEYAEVQKLILDKVVIEKLKIDTEEIKREVREALYPELKDTITQELLDRLRTQLTAELPPPMIEEVKRFIDENMHPDLRTELHTDLRDPLYNDLLNALKAMIEDMLKNVKFEQVDSFIPII